MITISYTEDTLYVHGHAGYAEAGSDIVCSAVSALVFTVAEYGTIKGTPGHAVVRATRDAIQFGLTGLRLISKEYPDYVKIGGVRNGHEE